jgi:twitching motility protein PilT
LRFAGDGGNHPDPTSGGPWKFCPEGVAVMDAFLKLVGELRQTKASDLHIFPGEPAFVRRHGVLEPLAGVVFSEEQLKKIILGTSSPRAREILGRHRQVNYAFLAPQVGRTRISAFFDKDRFALALRLIPDRPPKMADLGLPEALRKVLSNPGGLIIVGSPSGQGKTTTIASILDFLNSHYERNIITIENPVEITFKDERSTFIQRSIPLDVTNFFEGLNEAYRLDPDVVMTDSINYRDALDQALFLCESGRMVIGATDGGSCQQIIERLIYARPIEERDSLRGKLATHLSLMISQRLAPRSDGMGRVAVFDILVNSGQVRLLIKNENLVMLKTLQEQDQAAGMQTFDQHLVTLVRKNIVAAGTAIEYAEDPFEMSNRFSRR